MFYSTFLTIFEYETHNTDSGCHQPYYFHFLRKESTDKHGRFVQRHRRVSISGGNRLGESRKHIQQYRVRLHQVYGRSDLCRSEVHRECKRSEEIRNESRRLSFLQDDKLARRPVRKLQAHHGQDRPGPDSNDRRRTG